jgi:hypothetical protein
VARSIATIASPVNASWGLALASLFSALTVFIWRLGFPRIDIGLFSISMASHVIEQFARLPAQELKLIAFWRIVVALSLVLLFLR